MTAWWYLFSLRQRPLMAVARMRLWCSRFLFQTLQPSITPQVTHSAIFISSVPVGAPTSTGSASATRRGRAAAAAAAAPAEWTVHTGSWGAESLWGELKWWTAEKSTKGRHPEAIWEFSIQPADVWCARYFMGMRVKNVTSQTPLWWHFLIPPYWNVWLDQLHHYSERSSFISWKKDISWVAGQLHLVIDKEITVWRSALPEIWDHCSL